MKHCILVKWNSRVADKAALVPDIRRIFDGTRVIPGIRDVELLSNIIDRPNRYDLMIVITMDEAALPAYDASAPHKEWKATYGAFIESKAIFDYQE